MKCILIAVLVSIGFSARSQNPKDIVIATLQPQAVCGVKKIVIDITQDTWKWHIKNGPGVNVWARPSGQLTWTKIGSFTNTILRKTFSVSGFTTYEIKLANASIANVNVSPDPCIQFTDCSLIKTVSVIQCKPNNKPPSGN
jgi:hypothetical protein